MYISWRKTIGFETCRLFQINSGVNKVIYFYQNKMTPQSDFAINEEIYFIDFST